LAFAIQAGVFAAALTPDRPDRRSWRDSIEDARLVDLAKASRLGKLGGKSELTFRRH
jgi:hypothetical protein